MQLPRWFRRQYWLHGLAVAGMVGGSMVTVHSSVAAEGTASLAGSTRIAQGGPPPGRGPGFGRGRGAGQGLGHGPGGPGADKQFVADCDDFHFLLDQHAKITREVKQLPNGVDTVTESDDPEIGSRIRKHVKAMYRRVEESRPIHLRDPLFGAVFQHADQIQMKFEPTEKGIRVSETSDDPYVARLIQAHAVVVSGFVKNGFEEAHQNHLVLAPDTTQTSDGHAAFAVGRIFADFDAAYIPALALTNQEKQKPAEIAMPRLRDAWKTLTANLDDVLAADASWQEDREAIRDAIGAAARELKEQQLIATHETLEEIRGRLCDVRKRNQWSYDLDSLNDFHETMEEIVKPAMKSTAADVDESARADLRKLLQTAQQKWAAVEQRGFDASARNLDEATQQKLMEVVQQERQALTNLAEALDAENAEQILQAARAIKPPYAKLYMSFGWFPDQAAP